MTTFHPSEAACNRHHAYLARRGEIQTYFDRTAIQAWERLTSDAPLGRIRASVRAGRERMRQTLLSWLPADLAGKRVLDAGCGAGTLSVELARRGAEVVGIDLSPNLVALAAERLPAELAGRVLFVAGDMLDEELGTFDHVVLMDSLIHYSADDAAAAVAHVARRTRGSILFTLVPGTPTLAALHAIGRLFPRGERAPDISLVGSSQMLRRLAGRDELVGWLPRHECRVRGGFYVSHAVELVAS